MDYKKFLLGMGCALVLGAGFARSVMAEPVRLAVIAEGASADCRNLADLLQAELSNRDGIEMVERAEIDRVLAEQALTASGLVDESQRIRLGEILRAKGLLFVGEESSSNQVLRLRLVETTRGFLAAYIVQAVSGSMEPLVRGMVERVALGVPTLLLKPEQQTCISILHFGNSLPKTLKPVFSLEQFGDGVEQKLMEGVFSCSGTVLLERRRLGDLARESDFGEGKPSLLIGDLLVDGELALSSTLIDERGRPKVTMTLRVRNTGSGKEKVVQEETGLDDLGAVSEDMIDRLCGKILEMRKEVNPESLQVEVKALDNLVGQYRLPWASDAAFALDPSNRQRCREYVSLLLNQLDALPDDRSKAITVARVEQLCRKHGVLLLEAIDLGRNRAVLKFLTRRETYEDADLLQMLRPFRAQLLSEFERIDYSSRFCFFDGHIECLPSIFRYPSSWRRYLLRYVREVESSPLCTEARRNSMSAYLMHVYTWKTAFLEEQRRGADPLRRFYANHLLLKKERLAKRQAELTDSMVADLEVALAMTGWIERWESFHFGLWTVRGMKSRRNHWMPEALLDLYTIRPELKEDIQRKLFTRIRQLTDDKDFTTIELLDPDIMLSTIPKKELLSWYKQVLDKVSDAKEIFWGPFFDEIQVARRELEALPEFRTTETQMLRSEVILDTGSYNARLMQRFQSEDIDSDEIQVYPQMIYVDGDVLWIAIAGKRVRRVDGSGIWMEPVGFIKLDLVTQKIISERMTWVPTAKNSFAEKSVLSPSGQRYSFVCHWLYRVRDRLIATHANLGILSVPAEDVDLARMDIVDERRGLPMKDHNQEIISCSDIMRPTRDGVGLQQGQRLFLMDVDTNRLTLIADGSQAISAFGYPDRPKMIQRYFTDTDSNEIWLILDLAKPRASAAFRFLDEASQWEEMPLDALPPMSEQEKGYQLGVKKLSAAKLDGIVWCNVWRGNIVALRGLGMKSWQIVIYSDREEADHAD